MSDHQLTLQGPSLTNQDFFFIVAIDNVSDVLLSHVQNTLQRFWVDLRLEVARIFLFNDGDLSILSCSKLNL